MQKSIMSIITKFTISAGTGMLTCVPPFLSQALVVHTLKNYIKVFENENYINISCQLYKMTLEIIDFYCFNITSKGFLTMFIGIPYLTMCATRTEMTQVLKNILCCATDIMKVFSDGRNGSHGF